MSRSLVIGALCAAFLASPGGQASAEPGRLVIVGGALDRGNAEVWGAFISGLPLWGTLVGLKHKGRAVAGLMAQPFTGETFIADGSGSFFDNLGDKTIYDEFDLNVTLVAKK